MLYSSSVSCVTPPYRGMGTPRSGNHSASRHRGIQRFRDVEPGCIVLYLELTRRCRA